MKKIIYYITDHGKGHATRSIAIIKKLQENNFDVIIRNNNAKEMIKHEIPNIKITEFSIFLLIVIPMSLYRVDVDGNDGIFLRTTSSLENISVKVSDTNGSDFNTFLVETFELFIKYLGWVSLPIFIFFTPIGIFLIFKNRTFEKHTIILSMAIMSLPALVAYSVPALDTRYLYFLFPMFCVLSVITIHRLLHQKQNQNFLILN